MRWEEVENRIRRAALAINDEIKRYAPKNSRYKGYYKGYGSTNFIIVNSKEVYSNSNRLYNSITMLESGTKKHKVFTTSSNSSAVPHYERAVFKEEMEITLIDGTRGMKDYGENPQRLPISTTMYKDNPNYMFFLKAKPFVTSRIKEFDGLKINVSNDIKEFG